MASERVVKASSELTKMGWNVKPLFSDDKEVHANDDKNGVWIVFKFDFARNRVMYTKVGRYGFHAHSVEIEGRKSFSPEQAREFIVKANGLAVEITGKTSV